MSNSNFETIKLVCEIGLVILGAYWIYQEEKKQNKHQTN